MKKYAARYEQTDWPLWARVLFLLAAGAMLGWTIVGWFCE